MKTRLLRTSCPDGATCPAVHLTDHGTALVQGYLVPAHDLELPDGETVVEVPLDLLRGLTL